MSYKYYNRHPKELKTKDCVVRALSTAFDTDYNEQRVELNRLKREWGYDIYKSTDFLYRYLNEKGCERIIIKVCKGQPRVKGSDFCKLFPNGTYILKMLGHFSVCVDGVILDIWDCQYRSVYTAWKI